MESMLDRMMADLRKALNTPPDAEDNPEEFREWLALQPPQTQELYDLATKTYAMLADYYAGQHPVTGTADGREIVLWERTRQRDMLGYAYADGLERLAIEAVVIAWLHYLEIEQQYAEAASLKPLAHPQADKWDRRVAAAQKQLLRAMETLARLRRMGQPALQVNIGGQQVNQLKLK